MSEPGPVRWGLVGVESRPAAAALADAVGGVVPDDVELERLRSAGVGSLPASFETWRREVGARTAAIPDAEARLARLRREMVEVVVPPTILYLTIGCTLALSTLAFAFVFPDGRGVFFPASAAVLLTMVIFAVVRSLQSARSQRRLQDALHAATVELEELRAESRRPPALVAAAGLAATSELLADLDARLVDEGWTSDIADPDRPLILDGERAQPREWLMRVSRARLVLVVGEPLPDLPFDRTVSGEAVLAATRPPRGTPRGGSSPAPAS